MPKLGLSSSLAGGSTGANLIIPSFRRDFAGVKTLNHGIGPDITFTRTGTATYFDATGTLTTATADVPRFDHDPATLGSKGLLIEEGRTNSLPNSQMSGAVTGSAGTAPTGWSISGNANGLTRTITTGSINGFNYIDVSFVGTITGGPINLLFDPQATTAGYTASSGQTWTSSCYFALTGGSFPASSSPVIKVAERNSSNVTIASTNISISTATSTLQRFSGTRTLNQATTAKVTLDIRVDSVPDGASVNFTLRIAAPQLEQGSFATSYIPTTSAAVSRGADVATITDITLFYSTSNGTLFSEYTIPSIASASHQAVSIDNGSTNTERMQVGATPTSSPTSGFAGSGVSSFNTWASVNQPFKTAIALTSNDGRVATNGTLQTPFTSVVVPSPNRMAFGRDRNNSAYLNGHIRKVAYWNKRLPNAQLQALTT